MALLTNDPYGGGENLMDQGQSRITASATSGASARGVVAQYKDAMSNAAQLTQALRSLTGTISSQEQKNQRRVDKEYILTENANINALRKANDTGGIAGAVRSIFSGSSKPSPAAFMSVAATQGQKLVSEGIITHPLWKKFQEQAPRLIKDNPPEYKKQYDAMIETVRQDLLKRNQNFVDTPYRNIFVAQLNQAVEAIKSKQNIDAANAQIKAMRQAQLEKADANHVSLSNEINFFDLFRRTTGSTGTNLPYEAAQVARIESNFDGKIPHRSSDGSPVTAKGLFGINDARYATIIRSMKRDGLDVTQLTDRNSDAVNMKLFQYEWQKISETAKRDLGREATTAEKYLYWQLPSVAGGILKANPDTPIKDIIASAYINANKPIYGDGNISVKQVLDNINNKMKAGSATYGKFIPVASLSNNYLTANTWNNAATKFRYKWTELNPRKMKGEDATLRIHAGVVQALDQLSSALGRKVPVYSSHRTHEYNQTLRGSAKRVYDAKGNIVKRGSAHIDGAALDVGITNPDEQRKAIRMLGAMGVKSIGVYGSHLHFDIRGSGVWSRSGGKISVAEIKTLLKEGQDLANRGGFYRVQGFNGSPLTSREIAIKKYAETAGVPLAVAKENINKLTVTQSDTAVAAGDFNTARKVLSIQLADPNLSATDRLKFQQRLADVDAKENQRFNVEKTTIARQNSQATDAYYSQVQAEQNEGKPLTTPDRKKWSDDPAGQKAYENAQKFYELNPTAPFADRRKRLDDLRQSITENRPEFLRLIGLDPESNPTPPQVRDALIATQRDHLTHGNVSDLTEAYSKEIKAAPFTKRVTDAAVKSSAGTLAYLRREAGLAVPQETFTNAFDKNLAAQDELRLQQDINQHFQNAYGNLYRAKQEALGLTPTQHLNGADEEAVRKAALADTEKFTQAKSAELRIKWIDKVAKGVGEAASKMSDWKNNKDTAIDPRVMENAVNKIKTSRGFTDMTVSKLTGMITAAADAKVAAYVQDRYAYLARSKGADGVSPDDLNVIHTAARKYGENWIKQAVSVFGPRAVVNKAGKKISKYTSAPEMIRAFNMLRDPSLILSAENNPQAAKVRDTIDGLVFEQYKAFASKSIPKSSTIVTNPDGSFRTDNVDGDVIYQVQQPNGLIVYWSPKLALEEMGIMADALVDDPSIVESKQPSTTPPPTSQLVGDDAPPPIDRRDVVTPDTPLPAAASILQRQNPAGPSIVEQIGKSQIQQGKQAVQSGEILGNFLADTWDTIVDRFTKGRAQTPQLIEAQKLRSKTAKERREMLSKFFKEINNNPQLRDSFSKMNAKGQAEFMKLWLSRQK